MRRFRLITEDYEGSQILKGRNQQDFKKWYLKTTGRKFDDFYFDDIDAVNGDNGYNIPGVKLSMNLTWEEARDRLINYFDKIQQNADSLVLFDTFNDCFNIFCNTGDFKPLGQPTYTEHSYFTKFSYNNDNDYSDYGEFYITFYSRDINDLEGYVEVKLGNKKFRRKLYHYSLERELRHLSATVKDYIFKSGVSKLPISRINSDNFIYKLATAMDMTSTDIEQDGLQSLYSKPAMSYSNGFKYGDIFLKDSKLGRLINQEFNARVRAAWRYKDDPDIVLISTPGFNFISTTDVLGIEE